MGAQVDVEATLGTMLYVTVPGPHAEIFEREFPLFGNDHIRAKNMARDNKTVQYNIYVDSWHQRYEQAAYLLQLARVMKEYGYRCYLVNYGPAAKFKVPQQGVAS